MQKVHFNEDVLTLLSTWRKAGQRGWMVTVASTWGASPRPAGAMMAIGAGNELAGSVSGGCVEDDLVARVLEDCPDRPLVLSYGVTAEQAAARRLPCGGTLQLVVEAYDGGDWPDAVLRHLRERRGCVKHTDMADGRVQVLPADEITAPQLNLQNFSVPFDPPWRMVIVGAAQLSIEVARIAAHLDYAVVICEPRPTYRQAWPLNGVELLDAMPDDYLRANPPDPQTVVLSLSHDPRYDDLALLEALDSPAFYVGALGSRASSRARRVRLAEHFDMTEAQLARLSGPVGIDLGTRNPAEIALGILAEITARRRGVRLHSERGAPDTAIGVSA
ncbi:MAG: XdhC family protein [Gammaproteobacteria bacterium]|nr:XdhC family protein [Gammaproteobacteria bacterium]